MQTRRSRGRNEPSRCRRRPASGCRRSPTGSAGVWRRSGRRATRGPNRSRWSSRSRPVRAGPMSRHRAGRGPAPGTAASRWRVERGGRPVRVRLLGGLGVLRRGRPDRPAAGACVEPAGGGRPVRAGPGDRPVGAGTPVRAGSGAARAALTWRPLSSWSASAWPGSSRPSGSSRPGTGSPRTDLRVRPGGSASAARPGAGRGTPRHRSSPHQAGPLLTRPATFIRGRPVRTSSGSARPPGCQRSPPCPSASARGEATRAAGSSTPGSPPSGQGPETGEMSPRLVSRWPPRRWRGRGPPGAAVHRRRTISMYVLFTPVRGSTPAKGGDR